MSGDQSLHDEEEEQEVVLSVLQRPYLTQRYFIVSSVCNKQTSPADSQSNGLSCTGLGAAEAGMSLLQAAHDRGVDLISHLPVKETVCHSTKASQNSEDTSTTLSKGRISIKSDSKDQNFQNSSAIPCNAEEDCGSTAESHVKQGSPKHTCNADANKKTILENQSRVADTNCTTDSIKKPSSALLKSKLESSYVVAEDNKQATKGSSANANHLANHLEEAESQDCPSSDRGFSNDNEHCYASRAANIKEAESTESKTLGFASIPASNVGNSSKRWGELEKGTKEDHTMRETLSQTKQIEYTDVTGAVLKNPTLFYKEQERFSQVAGEVVNSVSEAMEQEEIVEALDLSLPKKRDRHNREKRCTWVWDDPECEGSLLMEVDEIEDESAHQGDVVQDDDGDDDYASHVGSFGMPIWDGHLSSHCQMSLPSLPGPTPSDLEPEETLLIDDQGIPYTLNSEGQKVPQMDTPTLSQVDVVRPPNPNLQQIKEEASSSLTAEDLSVPKQGLPSAPSYAPTGEPSPGVVSVTETTRTAPKTDTKHSHELPAQAKPTPLPALSTLPPQPIQIVANTASNTPILLLPSSQIQSLSTPTPNANPGLMTLSLPLTLTQNSSSSSPVYLVLSSVPGSSAQSPSPSTPLAVIGTSPVALPVASGVLDPGSTSQSSPALLGLKPVTSAPVVNLSGKSISCNLSAIPTSPAASSSSPAVTASVTAKQVKTEVSFDPPAPTTFREALLRLASEHQAENQPKDPETTTNPTSASTPESSQPLSPTTTSELPTAEHSPNPEPASSSGDPVDTPSDLAPAEDLQHVSSTSPLRPISPIYPTNHPKNPDPNGPRRILYCQYCPRVFYYLSDLERHSITHSQSKPHVCQLCGKAFKRSSHLERHKHIHTGQRNFACPICTKRFREAGELMRHQRVHTGEKPFQCLLCHMRFAERNTLRRHTKRKHQGQQQEAMDAGIDRASLFGVQGQAEESAEWYSSSVAEMASDDDDAEGD